VIRRKTSEGGEKQISVHSHVSGEGRGTSGGPRRDEKRREQEARKYQNREQEQAKKNPRKKCSGSLGGKKIKRVMNRLPVEKRVTTEQKGNKGGDHSLDPERFSGVIDGKKKGRRGPEGGRTIPSTTNSVTFKDPGGKRMEKMKEHWRAIDEEEIQKKGSGVVGKM